MSTVTRTLLTGLLAVALAGPAASQVRLQVIHNAPDPAAATVDVYVDGALTLDDFAFRTATPFLDLPSDADIEVAIAPGTSAGVGDAIARETFNLPTGAYQLIASGVLDPDAFSDNPDGVDVGFQLLPATGAQEAATDPDQVDVRVVHGSPDAPTVDVRVGQAVLVDDAAYTDVTGYLSLDPASYTLDVTTADGAGVASFVADLSGAGGAAVTVLASGFLTPGDDRDGPALGLLAVFADGATALLPTGAVSTDSEPAVGQFALGAPAPNPVAGRGEVAFSLAAPGRAEVTLYDALGRRVAVLADGAYGIDPVAVALDTGSLAAGVYVLQLRTADGARTRTVTVLR